MDSYNIVSRRRPPDLHRPIRARRDQLASFDRMLLDPSDHPFMYLRWRVGLQRRRLQQSHFSYSQSHWIER